MKNWKHHEQIENEQANLRVSKNKQKRRKPAKTEGKNLEPLAILLIVTAQGRPNKAKEDREKGKQNKRTGTKKAN
jgi:hypothetical protein